jgi:hypothetical protein
MRILWYLLSALFGLIGVLAAVRTIERLISGAGLITLTAYPRSINVAVCCVMPTKSTFSNLITSI